MTSATTTPTTVAGGPPTTAGGGPALWHDSADAAALRAEIRAVLSDVTAQPAWQVLTGTRAPEQATQRAARYTAGQADPRPLYRLLGARGLLAPAWPVAFGGRSQSPDLAAVVVEELVAAGIPDTPYTLSVQICGSFLLGAGSPAQRASVLPLLASGRRLCAVLYSEQDAGSDLAGLSTTAEPTPAGGWRLTGRKLWSVSTPMADLVLVAARTSQESSHYQGLSLFLLPRDAPGLTVRELPSLADEAFAEVLLDDVPAGAGDVVGPVGGAWPLITEALALERTGADHVAKARTWLALGSAAADQADRADRADQAEQADRPDQADWRPAAGRLTTRTAAARALSQQFLAGLADGAREGQSFAVRAAATKLWCSETAREVSDWTRDTIGDAVLWPAGGPDAVANGRLEAARRETPGLVISAGTSEMMREVVAVAGLANGPSGTGGTSGTSAAIASDGLLGSGSGPVEPLLADLTAAVRVAIGDGRPGGEAWSQLAALGVFGVDLPAAAGGLGLGCRAQLAICLGLGARGYDDGILDTLTAAAVLAATDDGDLRDSTLPALLEGRRRAALLGPGRPGRPLADPGDDGLLLVLPVLDDPDGYRAWAVLDPAAAGVVRRRRATAAGPVLTVAMPAGDPAGVEGSQPVLAPAGVGHGCGILAGDLLRRAAWLIGAADQSVSGTLAHARARRQFGTPLLSNQALAHRLADLAVHATALHALLSDLIGQLEQNEQLEANEQVQPAEQFEPAGRCGPGCLAAAAGLLAEAGRYARDAANAGIHLRGAAGMLRDSPAELTFHAVTLGIARGPAPDVLDRLASVSESPW